MAKQGERVVKTYETASFINESKRDIFKVVMAENIIKNARNGEEGIEEGERNVRLLYPLSQSIKKRRIPTSCNNVKNKTGHKVTLYILLRVHPILFPRGNMHTCACALYVRRTLFPT